MQNTAAMLFICADLVLLQIPDVPAGVETPLTVLAALAAVRVLWTSWQQKDKRADEQMAQMAQKMYESQERHMAELANIYRQHAELSAKQTQLFTDLINNQKNEKASN